MQLNGFPVSAKLPDDLGLGKRFWYWRGASGRSYIHSIYPVDDCPPSPGAVYVAVRNDNGLREVLAVGRFCQLLGRQSAGPSRPAGLFPTGTDEIHVHLLARDSRAADAVLDDLVAAIDMSLNLLARPLASRKPVRPALSFA